MVWQALSPVTFMSFFKGPASDLIGLSYIAAILGSLGFCAQAVFELVRKKRPVWAGILRLLLMLVWCFALAAACFVMAMRTAI